MGKAFDIVIIVLILLSILTVMLESVKSIDAKYHTILNVSEWVITILFTFEYIARIITVRKPLHYIFSFYGIIDLLSILPKYISLFVFGASSLAALRALRLMRIFKILKMNRFIGASTNFKRLLAVGKAKIIVFILFIIIFSVISGTIMYLIEGNVNEGFENIPKSIYWAIVTLTTVGYGDLSPQTPFGKALASLLMIMGYGIIAVPTGIVTVGLTQSTQEETSARECPGCSTKGHAPEADFCRCCGEKLS